MNIIRTDNFKSEIFSILKQYSSINLNLMISGGSLLEILNNDKFRELDTSRWKIWFADERFSLSDLNYTGALPFLSHLKNTIVYKMDVENENCVDNYNKILDKIDICLLGVGEDGHICSLFPNSNDLDRNMYVIKTYNSNVVSPQRMTVTLKFLNNMVKNLYFVIPPKKDKKRDRPHENILGRLKIPFNIILSSDCKNKV